MSVFCESLFRAAYVGATASALIAATHAMSETSEIAVSLAGPMIEWIAAKTDLRSNEHPNITFVTAEWMASRLGQKSMVATPEALYGSATLTVYLLEEWSPANIRHQSILLHELVHHLQILNGAAVSCPAQYNGLAYELQLEWLREHGISDPFEFLDITPTDVFVQSLCADPWGSLNDSWTSSSF
jgi:hypothetical protein